MATFCPLAVDWGDVATWVQAIGSIGAILVAIWVWKRQAELSRQTTKESLQPCLSCIRTVDRQRKPHAQIVLRNVGLGPAIIKSIDVSVNGVVMTQGQFTMIDVKRALKLASDTPATDTRTEWDKVHAGGTLPEMGDWLPAGKEYELFCVTVIDTARGDVLFKDHNERLVRELDQVKFRITFDSVFGDRETIKEC